MKKVLLDYDEISGNIYDSAGLFIFCYQGLNYEVPDEGGVKGAPLQKLKELKAMGLSVDEMRDLKDLDLL